MAASRKEGIQHEIELSAAWCPIVVSGTGLPTSLSAHQMPTYLLASHGPTSPVGPPDADMVPVGDDRLFWRVSAPTIFGGCRLPRVCHVGLSASERPIGVLSAVERPTGCYMSIFCITAS